MELANHKNKRSSNAENTAYKDHHSTQQSSKKDNEQSLIAAKDRPAIELANHKNKRSSNAENTADKDLQPTPQLSENDNEQSLTAAKDQRTIKPIIQKNKSSSNPKNNADKDLHPTQQSSENDNEQLLTAAKDQRTIKSIIQKNKSSSNPKNNTADKDLHPTQQSSENKNEQSLTAAKKSAIHKNKQSSNPEDKIHQQQSSEDKIHQQNSSENEAPVSFDLAILPLHRDNSKALTQHNMQVSLPATTGKTNKANVWNIWLQLNVLVSTNKNYFTGPDGSHPLYRYLIPSLRVERTIGRSAISLEFHPYNAALLKPQKGVKSYDTTAVIETRRLEKQFGPEMTLQYHYAVNKHLHVSAGLAGSLWTKAVISQKLEAFPTTIIPAKMKDWKGYDRQALTVDVELYYDLKQWQVGLRTATPFNNYTRTKLELLLRKRIRW
jgi:hypothetical protein